MSMLAILNSRAQIQSTWKPFLIPVSLKYRNPRISPTNTRRKWGVLLIPGALLGR